MSTPSGNEPLSSQDKPESSNAFKADEQIQAHRLQHQQKMKKLYVFVGVFVLITALVGIAYKSLTSAPSETSTADDTIVESLSQKQINEYRDAFKAALTEYETNIQPTINEIKFVGYATAKVGDLALLKDTVLSAFARGEFSQSKVSLEQLMSESKVLIAQWQEEFDSHLQQARNYFEQENIVQSQLSLNQAQALMPNHPGAILLQGRIDAFAEIANLLDNLQVAKVERNLVKQIDLMSSIVALDPQRDGLNDELTVAQTKYDQQLLSSALENAEQAIEQNKLAQAERYIAQAKAIKPNSKGAQTLTERIKQLQAVKSLDKILAEVQTAKQNDSWQAVQQLSTSGLKKYPNNNSLKTSQQQAAQILTAAKSLDGFIQRPTRLADENIRQAAQNTIQQSFSLSLQSPSLQAKIVRLGDIIDSYANPVAVTITSDGETYIIVVGVGHVGEHESKIIELTPGKYVLEGRRDGYRNKRINFTVEANTPMVLTLVCDERI